MLLPTFVLMALFYTGSVQEARKLAQGQARYGSECRTHTVPGVKTECHTLSPRVTVLRLKAGGVVLKPSSGEVGEPE